MMRWLEQNYGLNGTTSVQKWAQSMSCLTDGQPSAEVRENLSRPADAIRNHQAISRSLPAPTKLNWRATFAYRMNINTALNSETSYKTVQFIGEDRTH
jgi:hypothetical protein